MHINQLTEIVKTKIRVGTDIEDIIIEDKTYLHLKHTSHEKNKFHIKIKIKSKYLKKMNKIKSTKIIYRLIRDEMKKYIHSIQLNIF